MRTEKMVVAILERREIMRIYRVHFDFARWNVGYRKVKTWGIEDKLIFEGHEGKPAAEEERFGSDIR
jgi:hypothetical protein